MRRLRLLLDAGVLADAPVRDVFLGLADAELVELRWSDGVLDELRTLLVDEMGRPAAGAERLVETIKGAFPLGEVASSDEALAARLAGDDPEGLHPLVAAVTAEADLLVSHDRRRFPDDDTLAHWSLAVASPDQALAEMVEVLGADRVAGVFAALAGPLGVGPEAQLDRLRRLGQVAPIAAVAIGARLDAAHADELAAYVAASRPDGARAAVSELVNRVGDGDLSGMDMLLSPRARRSLGGTARVRHRTLQRALLDVLLDPGEWRFGEVADAAGHGAAATEGSVAGAAVVTLVHAGEPAARAARAVPVARGAGAGGDAADRLAGALLASAGAGPDGAYPGADPLARPAGVVTFAVVASDAGWRVDQVAGAAPA
jgi:PIN domain